MSSPTPTAVLDARCGTGWEYDNTIGQWLEGQTIVYNLLLSKMIFLNLSCHLQLFLMPDVGPTGSMTTRQASVSSSEKQTIDLGMMQGNNVGWEEVILSVLPALRNKPILVVSKQ